MTLAKKFWSVISRTCGYLALSVWIGHFYFWFSYFDSGPGQPDYSTGHYIGLNNHGNVHYITVSQDHKITIMEVAAFSLFAVGFLIQELIVRPPKRMPWENQYR